MDNRGLPMCFVDSKCNLICKLEDGSYELPGTPLSAKECREYRDYLSQWVNTSGDGNGDGENKSSGLGLLNIDMPQLFKIDWEGLFQRIADMLGLDANMLKGIAKAVLIIGAVILLMVILKK